MDVNTYIYKVRLEFINGSRYLMDYNNMINVFNAIDEDGDKLCTFKNILVHRNQGISYELQILCDT